MASAYEIVVAGGGIAGLSAGLAAARLGRRTLVLTGGLLGGHLLSIEKIEGYPGFPEGVAGYDLCPMAEEQAAEAGAEFAAEAVERLEAADGGWRIATDAGEYAARAVIVATGTTLRTLGVPGEERLRGKGVSHCASCDAPLLRGKVVAVVGGGDSALQEALTLAGAASRVVVLHRGGALGAQQSFRERIAAQANVEVRLETVVDEILGGDVVTGVRVRPAAGGDETTLEADGVFVYVGLAPCTGFVDGLLALAAGGGIPTDGEMRTALPGVFAAGTVRDGASGRAVASAGDGVAAAVAADGYLTDGAWGQ